MIEIHGLNEDQMEMLDFMWNELDSEEDYFNWYDSLDQEQQQQAELLQRLAIMACIDEDMLAQEKFDEAKSLLDKFKK